MKLVKSAALQFVDACSSGLVSDFDIKFVGFGDPQIRIQVLDLGWLSTLLS